MSDPEPSEKAVLRAGMRRVVAELSPDELAAAARAAAEGVTASDDFAKARTVMLFLASPGEPDPWPIAEAAFAAGKRVALPRMDWEARRILPLIVPGPDIKTEVRRHAIREPVLGSKTTLGAIDLVIVPGLAFDPSGFRLGRGAGFYDRFLGELRQARTRPRPPATVIGLCCRAQMVRIVPAEPHDQPVDGIATEQGLQWCR